MPIRVVVGQYGVQLQLKRILKTRSGFARIKSLVSFCRYQIVDLSTLYSPKPNKGGTAIVRTMPQTFQTCLEDQKLLRDGMCHDLSKRTTDKYLIPAMLTIEKYELSPIIVQRKRLLKLDIKDELQNQIHGMLVMIGIALFSPSWWKIGIHILFNLSHFVKYTQDDSEQRYILISISITITYKFFISFL